MSGFPSFPPGGSFPRSASEWTALKEAVQRLDRAVFGGGLTGLNIPSGRTVTQGRGAELLTPKDRFVVIVRTPLDASTRLTVREVRYADEPAQPCTETNGDLVCRYAWSGEEFEASPRLGLRAIEYEDDATPSAADTLSPPSDSTILRCFRNHDSWIVDKVEAGGEIRFGVVVTTWWGASIVVGVRFVTVNAQGIYSLTSPATDPVWVYAWPGTLSEDYTAFTYTGGNPLPSSVNILPILRNGSEQFIQQLFKRKVSPRPRNVRITDCVPVEVRF